MVRPLKKLKEDGTPYVRAPHIEVLLSQVLTAGPTTLPPRAAITAKSNPEYVPPEVLVHLIRHTLRMQDYEVANALLLRLGERCAQLLKHRVPDTTAFDAADVREEVISRLYELFVDDRQSPEEGVLDYFEVRFNHAFATLRLGVVRKALAATVDLAPLDEPAAVAEDGDPVPVELPDLSAGADVLLSAENTQLQRLIQALPFEERQAILWKYFYDLKTESTDPHERTVASVCGVSGSQIRSRLRSAYARLKKWMEE